MLFQYPPERKSRGLIERQFVQYPPERKSRGLIERQFVQYPPERKSRGRGFEFPPRQLSCLES